MRVGLIACAMLQCELEPILQELGYSYQPYWLERGLHDSPQRLREAVQAAVDQLSCNSDVILLAYGLCGGAMDGLRCSSAKLVLPLYHDCIQLLLAGAEPGVSKRADSLYFTNAWMEDDAFIVHSFQRALKKYGESKATKLFKKMLQGYRAIYIVDTGHYDIKAARRTLFPFSQKFGLEIQVIQGSNRILRQLLTGPWNENFYILTPGETLTTTRFLEEAFRHTSSCSPSFIQKYNDSSAGSPL